MVGEQSWRDVFRLELQRFAEVELRRELRDQLIQLGTAEEQVFKRMDSPPLQPAEPPNPPDMQRAVSMPIPPPMSPMLQSSHIMAQVKPLDGNFSRQNSPWQRGVSEGGCPMSPSTGEKVHEWRRHPRKLKSQNSRKPAAAAMPEPAPTRQGLIRPSKRFASLSVKLLPRSDASSQTNLWKLVEATSFNYFICSMILLNAMTIGVQTQYMAVHWTSKVPQVFLCTELAFSFIFVTELTLRIAAYRCDFFFGHESSWNLFDAVLILMQVAEQLVSLIIFVQGGRSNLEVSEMTDDTSVLRILRVLRLTRIFRVLRVVHLSGDLLAIFAAVVKGMRSFVWTVALLLLLMYVVGVFLTQSVTDHKIAFHNQNFSKGPLEDFYGSLASTMLALFQAISDGKEWRDMLEPLMHELTPWLALPFCVYVAFVAFALMNILTGIFVDKALQSGQEEKRHFLLQEVRSVFGETEKEKLSWEDFQAQLQNPHMQQLFEALDVDEDDAQELFHVLDTHHDGQIHVEDFVNGCLRLDGAAKAVDLAAFVEEYRGLSHNHLAQEQFVNNSLMWLMHAVQGAGLQSQMSRTKSTSSVS